MTTPKLTLLYTGVAVLFSTAITHSASITAAGANLDLTPPGFTGGTDVADLDAVPLGGDGFVLFHSIPEGGNLSGQPWNAGIIDMKPAYVTGLDGLASTSSGGWAGYDDVRVGSTTYNTGALQTINGGAATEVVAFEFTLGASVPASFTLGLLVDNTDNAVFTPTDLRVEGPGAVSASQVLIADGSTDVIKFDIAGGLAGETYTVYATQSGGSGSVIGGITFDSVLVPEPSSAALLGLGGLALIMRRRK